MCNNDSQNQETDRASSNSFISQSSLLDQLKELKVRTLRHSQNNELITRRNIKNIASYSLGIGVLTDIVIAVVLCYYLQRMRKNSSRLVSIVWLITFDIRSFGTLWQGWLDGPWLDETCTRYWHTNKVSTAFCVCNMKHRWRIRIIVHSV